MIWGLSEGIRKKEICACVEPKNKSPTDRPPYYGSFRAAEKPPKSKLKHLVGSR